MDEFKVWFEEVNYSWFIAGVTLAALIQSTGLVEKVMVRFGL